MPHFLHEYPTEILLTIFSKMDRTAFLRLSRSCKWIHNLIEENKRHIPNCVTDDKISITVQKPTLRRRYGYWKVPEPKVDIPVFYKLTVGAVDTREFLTYEMFCRKMERFHELRLAELEIYSEKTNDTVKLAKYLHTQHISCEKLTILFPQDLEYLPDELTEFLRSLKLVILPIQCEYDDKLLRSYNHLANNVEHLSLFEVQKYDVPLTLCKRNILSKKSVYIHYVHNYIQEDDPFEYEYFYDGDLLSFYKRFMSSSIARLKDFQIYFQNYRDGRSDPVLGAQKPSELLRYIAGDRQPQKASEDQQTRELSAEEIEEWNKRQQGSPTVFIEDPSNPDGTPLELEFSNFIDYRFYDKSIYGDRYNSKNPKKSLLLKTWLISTEAFHVDQLVVSITEGRKEKEHIMTLFADSSEKMRVYFAIAVLTDWDSYTRFIGLMDTKNYKFPMAEIEDDVKKILCP